MPSIHFSQTLYSAGLNRGVSRETVALPLQCRRSVTNLVGRNRIARRYELWIPSGGAPIRGTVSGKLLSTLCSLLTDVLLDSQPEGPLFLRARAQLWVICRSTILGLFICSLIHRAACMTHDFHESNVTAPLLHFFQERENDIKVYYLFLARMKVGPTCLGY